MNPSDDDLRALYRSERPEPPAALDDAIRRAAREELEGADAPPAPVRHRWLGPGLGAAAGVLLAALVVPLALREEQAPEPAPSRYAPSAPLSDPETIRPVQESFSVAEDAEAPPTEVARKGASSQDAGEARNRAPREPVSGASGALRVEPPRAERAPAPAAQPGADLAPAAELHFRMAEPVPEMPVVLGRSGSVIRLRAGWPRHDACTTTVDVGVPLDDLEIEPLGGTADGTGEGLRILAPDGPLVLRCTEQGWSLPAP
jgi:hypothetical protein